MGRGGLAPPSYWSTQPRNEGKGCFAPSLYSGGSLPLVELHWGSWLGHNPLPGAITDPEPSNFLAPCLV